MSFLSRLTAGLARTSSGISESIADIFTKSRLDDDMLEQLEEVLIQADIGAATAASLVAEFSRERFGKEVSPEEVKEALAALIAARLEKVAIPLAPQSPAIILVVGVNGNGKTTTIGKLASQFKSQGQSLMLAAADTFRAAAVEQLKVWGMRVGCEVISGAEGADPAAVAYEAVEKARAQNIDVLMIDTAGRLHNKQNLMAELEKIIKVIRRIDESAPHHVLQVLDATTGQNAIAQVKAFGDVVQVTGLVVTKLDGTAKAGVVVALADGFGLPIHAIGVGEGIEDLQPFSPLDFAKKLVGLGD